MPSILCGTDFLPLQFHPILTNCDWSSQCLASAPLSISSTASLDFSNKTSGGDSIYSPDLCQCHSRLAFARRRTVDLHVQDRSALQRRRAAKKLQDLIAGTNIASRIASSIRALTLTASLFELVLAKNTMQAKRTLSLTNCSMSNAFSISLRHGSCLL